MRVFTLTMIDYALKMIKFALNMVKELRRTEDCGPAELTRIADPQSSPIRGVATAEVPCACGEATATIGDGVPAPAAPVVSSAPARRLIPREVASSLSDSPQGKAMWAEALADTAALSVIVSANNGRQKRLRFPCVSM